MVMAQHAAADAGRPSGVIGDASARPGADQTRHIGRAGVVVAAKGIVVGERAIAEGERVRANRVAAIARNDGATQPFAHQDYRTSTGVAVAADGRIMVKGAVGESGVVANFAVKSTSFGAADSENIGAGGGGIVASESLIIAEIAVGDLHRVTVGSDDGPAEGVIHER